MKHAFLIVLLALPAFAQPTSPPANPKPGKIFEELADSALMAMTERAEELKIKGAAVVAFIEGDTTKSWSSKMVVVGAMKDAPTEKNHGANLLAIAYSKAAEMAETLKDSGSAGRPPTDLPLFPSKPSAVVCLRKPLYARPFRGLVSRRLLGFFRDNIGGFSFGSTSKISDCARG